MICNFSIFLSKLTAVNFNFSSNQKGFPPFSSNFEKLPPTNPIQIRKRKKNFRDRKRKFFLLYILSIYHYYQYSMESVFCVQYCGVAKLLARSRALKNSRLLCTRYLIHYRLVQSSTFYTRYTSEGHLICMSFSRFQHNNRWIPRERDTIYYNCYCYKEFCGAWQKFSRLYLYRISSYYYIILLYL